MQTSKPKLIQIIHVAKTKLSLSDDDYRAILESVSGKSSCKEMSLFELEQVLKALKTLGFSFKKMLVHDIDVGQASEKQIKYIKGMWEVCARVKTEEALRAFVKRLTGAQHLRWLDRRNAEKVILALRKMMADAGFNPDTVGRDDGRES